MFSSFNSSFNFGRRRRPAAAGGVSDPNLALGTQVDWTDNTIWYTAGASNPMGNRTYAVRPIMQLMYAHKAIKIPNASTTSLGITTTQIGGQWRWQFSVSSVDNTIGSFSAPVYGSALLGVSNATGGVTYTGNTNIEFNIPANRYFIIIRSPGPLYTASTAVPGNGGTNRTAYINGEPVFTTLSYAVVGSSTSVTGTVSNLPSQFGGNDTGYNTVSNYNPAFGITFTVV